MEIKTRSQAKHDGDKLYLTGKKCKHGHDCCRYTRDAHCQICVDIKRKNDIISGKNKECSRRYYQNNKQHVREMNKKWEENNKIISLKYRSEYKKRKRKQNPLYRLNANISNQIYQSLKGLKNSCHWENFVDFTLIELKEYLESLWEPWMNWNNWGLYDKNHKTWQIDHIKPVSLCSFEEAWQLSNLQPLEAIKNLSKGNKYTG